MRRATTAREAQPQAGQPGGGIGAAHQHARSAVEVQVVDSGRAGVAAGGGCGLPAAQAGGWREWERLSELLLPVRRGSHDAGTPAAKNAALLNALKEELFALESESIAGTLPPDEYAEQKAALETVLKRALKKTVISGS